MDWTAMLLLGAYHGINPAMGWLFAVALGMQQGNVRGVYRALPPMAVGHTASVAVVLVIAAAMQTVVSPETVRLAAASALVALGLRKLWRHRHPRYGGMRVGFRDLVVWSFLMASAHGAGLMLVPFAMRVSMPLSAASIDHSTHGQLMGQEGAAAVGLILAAHTLSYFVVMSAAAYVVYHKLGLAVLRTAWFDMDRLWASALLITGALILLL